MIMPKLSMKKLRHLAVYDIEFKTIYRQMFSVYKYESEFRLSDSYQHII